MEFKNPPVLSIVHNEIAPKSGSMKVLARVPSVSDSCLERNRKAQKD